MSELNIAPVTDRDKIWMVAKMRELWHSEMIVSRGVLYNTSLQPGFIASTQGEPLGVLVFNVSGSECEVLTLNSWKEGMGVGSALLEAVVDMARSTQCNRLWLTTTNDNSKALRFYQKRGWYLTAAFCGAITQWRTTLKPQIPLLGDDGIPIRDELVLDYPLGDPQPDAG